MESAIIKSGNNENDTTIYTDTVARQLITGSTDQGDATHRRHENTSAHHGLWWIRLFTAVYVQPHVGD